MLATSEIDFTNECCSVGVEQHTGKRAAPKRIPRPPNAFLLYRSDFLKRQAVPPDVERRQQNLSRIAGQCWNMLPDAEKAIWFAKAAHARAEHRIKYPSSHNGPFQKDTNRLSTKEKRRGSAVTPGRSSGPVRRSRLRQQRIYQSPYPEGMFAAIHDLKQPSAVPQACLLSSSPALESSLSTSRLLSPLSLPQLLPLFSSDAHSNHKDSQSATLEGLMRNNKTSACPLHPFDSETSQWGLSNRFRDLGITSGGIASPEPYRAFQHDHFPTCVPFPSPEYPQRLQTDPIFQVSSTLPGSAASSPVGYGLANSRSLANDSAITENLIHFDSTSVPLYPLHRVEPNNSYRFGM